MIACPSCGTPQVKRTYNQLFCRPERGQRACKDVYWNTLRPSERSGRTSVEGHARAAERRALVRVLADAVQAQLGGQLSGRGELTFGGHSATPSKLDLKRVADAVLLWTTTPSRDAGSDG